MNAEFNWWLLIVGLVVGAGLVWYVVMDARRGDADVDARERRQEAAWLSVTLAGEGFEVPPEAAERLLDLHRAYLEAPPPDPVVDDVAGPVAPVQDAVSQPPAAVDPADPDRSTTVEPSELAGDDGVGRRP